MGSVRGGGVGSVGGPYVAGDDLIDTYLGELAARLRWRRDVDELIDELGDHLWATAEELELAGEEVDVAQRAAL